MKSGLSLIIIIIIQNSHIEINAQNYILVTSGLPDRSEEATMFRRDSQLVQLSYCGRLAVCNLMELELLLT